MSHANIVIPVDLTNPGQFFACCGLLELADRLWPGAEGWFERRSFCIQSGNQDCSLKSIFDKLCTAEVIPLDPVDKSASPLLLPSFDNLRLDWWKKVEASKGQTIAVTAQGEFQVKQPNADDTLKEGFDKETAEAYVQIEKKERKKLSKRMHPSEAVKLKKKTKTKDSDKPEGEVQP